LEKQYDLIAVRIPELGCEMLKLISGNDRAKHAALWEGPFEYYVWLDSDAIVWGDFTPQVRTGVDFQIFWSEIFIPANATEMPGMAAAFFVLIRRSCTGSIQTSNGGARLFQLWYICLPAECNPIR
jgi:hypothetical protein